MSLGKNLLIICTEMTKTCMDGQFQKLSIDAFEWRKNKFTFDKEFIQNYDKDSDKG